MLTYHPPVLQRSSEIIISPWSLQSVGPMLWPSNGTGPAGANYVTASLVIYVPFSIPEPVTFTKMWWLNGSAVAGNYDVGIYALDGTRLVSAGSTAAVGVSQLQSVDITDTVCARGTYYMAIVSDTSGITQKILATAPAAGIPQSFGLLQQASVTIPLSTGASPATFAKYASAFIPAFGVQGDRVFGP